VVKRSQEYGVSGVGLLVVALLMYVTRASVLPSTCTNDRSVMACYVAHEAGWSTGMADAHLLIICAVVAIAGLCFIKATLLRKSSR
jgi:hypothetical protein